MTSMTDILKQMGSTGTDAETLARQISLDRLRTILTELQMGLVPSDSDEGFVDWDVPKDQIVRTAIEDLTAQMALWEGRTATGLATSLKDAGIYPRSLTQTPSQMLASLQGFLAKYLAGPPSAPSSTTKKSSPWKIAIVVALGIGALGLILRQRG